MKSQYRLPLASSPTLPTPECIGTALLGNNQNLGRRVCAYGKSFVKFYEVESAELQS
ncbi:MAG: hypothetical protein KME19_06895 [Microcoleus vaginatus WJT46-NPBG5]|nr:hypothetical protein [Microcoleus vaginatus WJT46-NPBG5]